MIPNFGQNTNRLETKLTERIKIHENASQKFSGKQFNSITGRIQKDSIINEINVW